MRIGLACGIKSRQDDEEEDESLLLPIRRRRLSPFFYPERKGE
jgi:hypothetical protein